MTMRKSNIFLVVPPIFFTVYVCIDIYRRKHRFLSGKLKMYSENSLFLKFDIVKIGKV